MSIVILRDDAALFRLEFCLLIFFSFHFYYLLLPYIRSSIYMNVLDRYTSTFRCISYSDREFMFSPLVGCWYVICKPPWENILGPGPNLHSTHTLSSYNPHIIPLQYTATLVDH